LPFWQVQLWFLPDVATIQKVKSAARRRSAVSVRQDAKTSAVTAKKVDAAMLLRNARVSAQIARAHAEDARSLAQVSAKNSAQVSARVSAKRVAKTSARVSARVSATKNATKNAKT